MTTRKHRYLSDVLAVLALTLVSLSSRAATITPNSTSMAIQNDSVCTLPEAAYAINNGVDYNGCGHTGTYGTDDTIVLNTGTYVLSSFVSLRRSVKLQGNGGSGGRADVVIDSHAGYEEAIYADDSAHSPSVVEIHDLTISSVTSTAYMTGITVVGGCPSGTCTTVKLYNTRVTGFSMSGIQVWGNTRLECHSSTRIDHNVAYQGGGIASYSEGTGGNINGAFDGGTVIENNAADYGGGIYATGTFNLTGASGNPVIVRSNSATYDGGGVYWDQDGQVNYLTIGSDVTFDSNSAAIGGAWYAADSNNVPNLNTITYTTNTASTSCAKYRYNGNGTQVCVN